MLLPIAGLTAQDAKLQFTALDENGRAFGDLQPEDIRIVSKGTSIQPTSLAFTGDSPLSVLIMVDASASQERVLPIGKQVAESFIGGLLKPSRDHVGILSFSSDLTLVHDLSNNFASAISRLKQIKFEVPAGFLGGGVVISRGPLPPQQRVAGSTSLYDSVHKAIEAFAQVDGKGGRKVIFLISDGVSTYGDKKLKDVAEISAKSGIPVYAVGVGDNFYQGVDEKGLKKIAEETGGMAIVNYPAKADMSKLLFRFDPTLRNNYIATIPPGKGESREVSVEIVSPVLKKRLRVISPRRIH